MSDQRIESHGFNVGRWHFPPFSVGPGECLTLFFPREAIADRDHIVACLSGADAATGLSLCGKVAQGRYAMSASGWRNWFHNPSTLDWLKSNSTLSGDAARSFLAAHRIDWRIPLNRYGGTPRMLLGLAAAFSRKPDAMVFSTEGLDPLGIRDVFRVVSEHLAETSAVYLSWPVECQGQESHASFPGSLGVTVIDDLERVDRGSKRAVLGGLTGIHGGAM